MIARKILLAAVSAIVVLVGSSVSAGDDDKETKKLQTYQAELKTAADPVGVAIRMARDESALCAFAGMDELVNHWRDARAAKTLAELAAARTLPAASSPAPATPTIACSASKENTNTRRS